MKKALFTTIPLILFACGNTKEQSKQIDSLKFHQPDSNAISLNNKAARLIGDAGHSYDSLKTLLYDSAVMYLDQAIEIDSLYILAYTNKAQALRQKGSYEQALAVLNKVLTIKPDFAEVIMGQGFLLEKIGSADLAHERYKEALRAYEKRLVVDPKDVKSQSDIAFLYIFLEDKNAALDEIQDLILKNPESEELKMMESAIKNFDKEKFIKEY